MSYRIFLDSFLLPFKMGEGPAVEALNTAIKSDRQKLKRIFTESGQPGDMFRQVAVLTCSTAVCFWSYRHCDLAFAVAMERFCWFTSAPARGHAEIWAC